jgi:hypothetical protein
MDGTRVEADTSCHINLVANGREKGAYEQGRSCTLITQEFGGEKIHQTFSPSRMLDNQDKLFEDCNSFNSLPLVWVKGCLEAKYGVQGCKCILSWWCDLI